MAVCMLNPVRATVVQAKELPWTPQTQSAPGHSGTCTTGSITLQLETASSMTNELIRWRFKKLRIISTSRDAELPWNVCGVVGCRILNPKLSGQHALFDSADRSKNKTVMGAPDSRTKRLAKTLYRPWPRRVSKREYRLSGRLPIQNAATRPIWTSYWL